MKGRNPWNTPVTIIIAVIGIIATVALVTVIILQNRQIPPKFKVLWSVVSVGGLSPPHPDAVCAAPPHQYGVVMDAGSSHTSVYTYRWPAHKENDTGRVEQLHACQVDGPGISSYASAPWGAGTSLKACMREAEQQVPDGRRPQTPLYLGATAGMRLLRSDVHAYVRL